MSRKLILLFVGSTEKTRQQVDRILSHSPYEVTLRHVPRVDALGPALAHARDEGPGDVVLCEQSEPDTVARCIELLRTSGHDSPVLVLSEANDAEAAVRALKAGAHDWILIRRLPERLLPAIEQALSDVRAGDCFGNTREIRETRLQLRQSEERYRRLVETMGDGLLTIDREGVISYANQALAEIFEMPVDRVVGSDVRSLFDEENTAILTREIERRFTEGLPGAYEVEADTGTGRRITLRITATPLRNDEGNVIASLGVVTDITEQRRVEEELRRIKTAVDNSSDAIAVTDAHQVPVYLNPAYVEISGYTLEEMKKAGGARATFATEDEYRRVFGEIKKNGAFVGEFEGRDASGRTFPVMARIDLVRDARGEVAGIVAVGSDITERRQAEERRRFIRARLAFINRLNQMLNAGESVDDIIAAGADGLGEILDAHHVHLFMRRKADDGDELVLRYSNMPREIAQRVFSRSGQDLQIVLPLREDTQLWKIYQTGRMMEIREEHLEQAMQDIEQWADPSPVHSGMQIARDLEIRYLCLMPLTHGGVARGHVSVSRSEDRPLNTMEKGILEGFAHQMAVILDKARTESEISRLNQLLQGIIENAAVWFSVLDHDRNLIIWNRAAQEITGYSRDQIHSSAHLMELLYPDEERRQQAYSYLDAAFRGELDEKRETSITRADGSERRIAWHLRTFDAGGAKGTGLVIIGRDVTERRQLQEQLQRVQRMDAVGTLAGGIAHDFNNVLTAIIGHAELLADESDEGSVSQWHADQISENAERASRLTRQLLEFSRKQPSEPEIVHLNRLIVDMEEMLRRVMPDDIDLQLDLSNDLGYTEIDPSQVEQIVMNLVLNARDAMPDGGQVQVRTANATLSDDSLSKLFDAEPGEYVTLQVADTGVGMDEETEARIFEPFFTTKQGRGGTGLGLSTVYGLVRQSRGAITVYSEVGKGTLFRIYLPRVDTVRTKQPRTAHTEQVELRGDETMIVVEDADNLRDLIGTILNMFGYTVYTAATGKQALALEEEHRGKIDLVVTDVVMPEMSGTELADKLLEITPNLKILFISGYPNERAISAGRTDERFSFLQKPFSATELGHKVREMLD
ncbi:MAG: PAS domain S-box protein [Armatimonadota bacterium]